MHASIFLRLATCLVALAPLAPRASGQIPAEDCHTRSVPQTMTNWQFAMSFPRFDPANRVLVGVRARVAGELRGQLQIESLHVAPVVASLVFGSDVRLLRPDASSLWAGTPALVATQGLAAYDGTLDYAGPSGFTWAGLVVPVSGTTTSGAGADLALFTGPAGAPGTISLVLRATNSSSATAPFNPASAGLQLANVDVQLCYLSFPDCNHNGIPDHVDIAAGTATDCDANLVPDPCQPLDQNNDCDLSGLLDACDVVLLGAPDCDGNLMPDWCQLDSNGDGVMDYCQDGGTPYCFGDGGVGASACPCATAGVAGAGCPNSTNASGATLAASGLPSSFYDWMRLEGSGMPPNSSVMYFQGTAQASAPTGFGLALGDGLLCATGTIVRLGSRQNTNGQSRLPSNGSTPIRILGQIPPGGGVARYYQAWYRDVNPNYCTPSRYNLTNGVRVDWVL